MDENLSAAWSFGVGCLAFEYAPTATQSSLGKWIEDVTKTLESIPTVKNLIIQMSSDEDSLEWPIYRPFEDDDSHFMRRRFTPEPMGVTIDFDISIPSRFHAKFGSPSGYANVGEQFKVYLEYGHDAPVAFVVCLDGDPKEPVFEGSDAVLIVRRFLADTLSKSDSKIRLRTVGPSPFHANFQVQPGIIDEPFIWNEVYRQGYGNYAIQYSVNQFENQQEAWEWLRTQLVSEFSLFYEVERLRGLRISNEALLQEKTEELITISTIPGVRAWFRRTFGTSRLARELGLLALRVNLELESDKRWLESSMEGLSRQTDLLGIAKRETESSANESFSESANNALAMVNFLEGGRSKEFEVAVVASSTVLGAAAGAMAALLAGG